MNIENFLDDLADVVDTGMTHALSFNLRRLNNKERAELSLYLRNVADSQRKTK